MIQKLQTGAAVRPQFAAAIQPHIQATTAKSSSDDEGLISKDLMKQLYTDGIPVDVDNLVRQISEVEYKIGLGFPINPRTVRTLEANINRVKKQSEYLKQAEERAVKNDALGEIAVGDRGQLFVFKQNGDISQVSMGEYDYEKHGAALTVNELIEQRKFNPTQAYDAKLTSVIGNSVGMSKVVDYIQKIVTTVGSSETQTEAYTDIAGIVGREAAKKPSQQQLAAMQELNRLAQIVGPDAIFKETMIQKTSNIKEAFEYIQSVLPRNMMLQLQGRFVANGMTPKESLHSIQQIIGQALMSANNQTNTYKIDYDNASNTAAKSQQRNLGVLEQLVQGSLGKRDYKLMSSKNSEFSLNLHGTGVGNLATFNNNIVDKTPLSVALQQGLAPLVDENHITMGNQKLPSGALDSILYYGQDVINVWAPVNSDGDIDLEGLQVLSEIQSICDTNPNLTKDDKNALLQKHQLDGYFDDKGTFHGTGQMAQFLVMTGLTSEKLVDEDVNPFVDKLSRDDKKLELAQIERIYGQLNKGVKGAGKYEFQMGMFNGTTDLYRVPIFMRLNQTAQIDAGTFSDKGPLVQTPSYAQQLAYDQTQYAKSKQLITPSTQALYE